MAHFAEIDSDNTVLRVLVVDNEIEATGAEFLSNLLGGTWIQTSYNATIRKNFAQEGSKYDPVRDAFIPNKIYASWVLNETTCQWESPIPYPEDGKSYIWDEDNINWVEAI